MQFQEAATEIFSEYFKQNPLSKVFNKSFQGFSLDYQNTLFPEQLFMTRS